MILPLPHTTARELLAHVAGSTHSTHSVASRKLPSRNKIEILCSCGEVFKVPNEPVYVAALRNVRVPDDSVTKAKKS